MVNLTCARFRAAHCTCDRTHLLKHRSQALCHYSKECMHTRGNDIGGLFWAAQTCTSLIQSRRARRPSACACAPRCPFLGSRFESVRTITISDEVPGVSCRHTLTGYVRVRRRTRSSCASMLSVAYQAAQGGHQAVQNCAKKKKKKKKKRQKKKKTCWHACQRTCCLIGVSIAAHNGPVSCWLA